MPFCSTKPVTSKWTLIQKTSGKIKKRRIICPVNSDSVFKIWERISLSSFLTKDGYNFFCTYLSWKKFSWKGKAARKKKFRSAFGKVRISLVPILVWNVFEIALKKSRISFEWAFLIFLHHLLYIPCFWYENFLSFFFLGFLSGRWVSAADSDSQYLSRDLPVIFDANRFNRNQISSSEILHMLPAYKNRESGRGALVPRQHRSLQNGPVLSSSRDCYRVRMRVLLIWLNLTTVVAFLSEKRFHGQK